MKRADIDVCDFHSHILPNVDHGSYSVGESVSQLKIANKCGVTKIVATPHFYPHRHNVEDFLLKRNSSFAKLRDNLNADYPQIKLGAEILLCNNIHHLPMIEKLSMGKDRILLIELPFNDFSEEYLYTVSSLIDNGFMCLLAHADRYPKEIIEQFLPLGVKLQLNASSLSTIIRRKYLYNWIENNYVSALGSDIHRIDKKAYTNFCKAISKLGENIKSIKRQSDAMWDSM